MAVIGEMDVFTVNKDKQYEVVDRKSRQSIEKINKDVNNSSKGVTAGKVWKSTSEGAGWADGDSMSDNQSGGVDITINGVKRTLQKQNETSDSMADNESGGVDITIGGTKKTVAKQVDLKEIEKSQNELKSELSNKITKFYASNQGETHLADSDNGKIQDMMLYGKSSQDGTPTSENPVEIKSVVNPVVKVCGKNLLKSTSQSMTMNGVAFTNNGDGTYTLNGTATKSINFAVAIITDLSGKRIVGCPSGGSNGTYSIYAINISNWGNHQYDYGNGVNVSSGFSKNIKWEIRISIGSGYTCNNLVFKPMVTTDLSATYDDFESYKEPYLVTLPYTLNAIPVSSGGNVTIDGQKYIADYVDVERGKLVRMVDSSKLDNTQSIVDKTEWLLAESQEIELTQEETQTLKTLATYYPTTNISVNSEQLDGYTVFNYPISMQNGWNYVKQQLNDNRDYIYDMDTQSAEAYVNSEYAVALTELEV